MTTPLLRRVLPAGVRPRIAPGFDADTLAGAATIVADVRRGGEPALLRHAERLGDWTPGTRWIHDRAALEHAHQSLDPETRDLLVRVAARIRHFASAQRNSLGTLDVAVDGGRAGHDLLPMQRAGCYVPAGQFPLLSSLLMTVVTAKAAGVGEVWVASPRPDTAMLGAAAIAGADGVLGIGGAQAIAALAYGAGPLSACDIVVGPGNRWVTAAKHCIAGDVAIDFLAGPSELLVLADESANAEIIASDLLAQAEHDVDAFPVLVTTDAGLADRVDLELTRQLDSLPASGTARAALANGMTIVCADLGEVIGVCDILAPEHLQLCVTEPATLARRLQHAGALFLGQRSAEVFGDYGIGPNHVLPTGAASRYTGGLSVLNFLRLRTWVAVHDATTLVPDVAALARLEGLEAHARAAEVRTAS